MNEGALPELPGGYDDITFTILSKGIYVEKIVEGASVNSVFHHHSFVSMRAHARLIKRAVQEA